MPESIPVVVKAVSMHAVAFFPFTKKGSAISEEAGTVQFASAELTRSAERSQALFGAKQDALRELRTIAESCAHENWDNDGALPLDRAALRKAEDIIRALPDNFPLPELAPEPDGSVSMDWIRTSRRLYSISVGPANRLAFAWLDGTDKGHGVLGFDGINLPVLALSDIERIALDADVAVRTA